MTTGDVPAVVVCGVCEEVMQHPAMLPCGHSFCRGCVQPPQADTKLSHSVCATCEAPFEAKDVPAADVAALRTLAHAVDVECGAEVCGWRGKLAALPLHRDTCPGACAQLCDGGR